MRNCPFCAEQIQDEAIKCRFCGEFLDETSLAEAFVKKTTDRLVFNKKEAADYLRVSLKVIDKWVTGDQMPYAKLPNQRGVVFRRKDLDKWIMDKTITEYDRFVYEKKTIDQLLPEGYTPPTNEEMMNDYCRELHEKYIASHARKVGCSEEEAARGFKKGLLNLGTKHNGLKVKLRWDEKRMKYNWIEGEEHKKALLDEGFQTVITEMSVLMMLIKRLYNI
jgi:hypothetical protein